MYILISTQQTLLLLEALRKKKAEFGKAMAQYAKQQAAMENETKVYFFIY